MARDIIINIDVEYLSQALAKIKNFETKFEFAIYAAIAELGDLMRAKVYEELSRYGLSESELGSGVTVTASEDGISIYSDSGHAAFVEFGTGVVGERHPHPDPVSEGWAYNTNKHGDGGWWYPTTESDPNPTKYYSNKQGRWLAWTKGMPSRPFMYNTWKYGVRMFPKLVDKHVERIRV